MNNTPKITIQNAKPEDAIETGEVFYKTWLATYPNAEYGITVDDIKEIWKDRKQADGSKIKNISKDESFLTAKYGNKIVGVCRLIKYPDNELKAIYILPQYQRLGIGKMFWKQSLKFFDLKKDIIINVAVYNKKAIEFYKKLGFDDARKKFTKERLKMKSGAIIPEMEMVLKANKIK